MWRHRGGCDLPYSVPFRVWGGSRTFEMAERSEVGRSLIMNA